MDINQPTTDNQNPYQPPSSHTLPPTLVASTPYYVVSKKKFFILFFASLSLYTLYWFYKQWTIWKERTGENIWPVPRAIFNIFFTHSLFAKIYADAENASKQTSADSNIAATFFVIAQLAINVSDNFTGEAVTPDLLITLVFFAVSAVSLWAGQKHANIASLDPEGSQNNNLTAVNYIWIVVGGIFWLLAFFGMYAEITGLI